MTSAIRARREAEDGFTLIELLVVVIIIGILAAIAIPAFLNQRERAWQAELTSTARNVALDIEADATAEGGDYTAIFNGANDPANTVILQTYASDLQNSATDPVTLTFGDASTSAFCFTGFHTSIGTNGSFGNVAYDSDAGGLQDFDPDGNASC